MRGALGALHFVPPITKSINHLINIELDIPRRIREGSDQLHPHPAPGHTEGGQPRERARKEEEEEEKEQQEEGKEEAAKLLQLLLLLLLILKFQFQ